LLIDLILKWSKRNNKYIGLVSKAGHGSLFGVGRANNANNVGNDNNVNGVAGPNCCKDLSKTNLNKFKNIGKLDLATINIKYKYRWQNMSYKIKASIYTTTRTLGKDNMTGLWDWLVRGLKRALNTNLPGSRFEFSQYKLNLYISKL
jgi:phosphopentomutase